MLIILGIVISNQMGLTGDAEPPQRLVAVGEGDFVKINAQAEFGASVVAEIERHAAIAVGFISRQRDRLQR